MELLKIKFDEPEPEHYFKWFDTLEKFEKNIYFF